MLCFQGHFFVLQIVEKVRFGMQTPKHVQTAQQANTKTSRGNIVARVVKLGRLRILRV